MERQIGKSYQYKIVHKDENCKGCIFEDIDCFDDLHSTSGKCSAPLKADDIIIKIKEVWKENLVKYFLMEVKLIK